MATKNNLLEKIWVIIREDSKKLNKIGIHVAVLNKEMGGVQKDISAIRLWQRSLTKRFVGRAEFDPVKKIVFGAVKIILVVVFGAIIGLVIISR